jgi:hypothetical protein
MSEYTALNLSSEQQKQIKRIESDYFKPVVKHGFMQGSHVINKVPIVDENGRGIPANQKLRIVAIVPKVYLTNPLSIQQSPEYYDNKEYFLNLVRANQESDSGNRFRVNFVTVKKWKRDKYLIYK